MCHCTLWETEVQDCPCKSLRSNFGQILIFFGSFLWHPGQSWRKHCKSCNTLQHGLKIDIYCCKNNFFSPPGWTPPPPTSGHETTSRVPLATSSTKITFYQLRSRLIPFLLNHDRSFLSLRIISPSFGAFTVTIFHIIFDSIFDFIFVCLHQSDQKWSKNEAENELKWPENGYCERPLYIYWQKKNNSKPWWTLSLMKQSEDKNTISLSNLPQLPDQKCKCR